MTVKLSEADYQNIRNEYARARGKRGIVSQLASKYGVTRQWVSNIVNGNRTYHKLRKLTQQIDVKKAEIRDLDARMDTISEREELISSIKFEIDPLIEKARSRKATDIMTEADLKAFYNGVLVIDKLLGGIDGVNKKIDVHLHFDRIINIFQNLSDEEGRKLTPYIKEFLCRQCPFYKRYKEETAIDVKSEDLN